MVTMKRLTASGRSLFAFDGEIEARRADAQCTVKSFSDGSVIPPLQAGRLPNLPAHHTQTRTPHIRSRRVQTRRFSGGRLRPLPGSSQDRRKAPGVIFRPPSQRRQPRNACTLFETHSFTGRVSRAGRQECLRNAVIGSPIGDLRLGD